MTVFLALLPILFVILTMVFLRWSGQRAGLVGWLASILIGYARFGLTPQVFWVSQLKGLYLSIFVLAILWPALLLYQIVRHAGGIQAIAESLQHTMQDRGLLLVGLAWAFSGTLEGLAGFGLPIAVVAPMLVGLGVEPVMAVAATAIGHSWSVTFGDMGVIFQTLVRLTGYDPALLAPPAAGMLGVACLACGWSAMAVLRQSRAWLKITLVALGMALAQYLLAIAGLVPLSAFGAGLVGMILLILWSYPRLTLSANPRGLWAALGSYGSLTALLILVIAIQPINMALAKFSFTFDFPAVSTSLGFETPAATRAFQVFIHPGFSLTLTALASYTVFRSLRLVQKGNWRTIAADTGRAAIPTSLGVLFMVGLSTLMEHTGMMLILAQALSQCVGAAFPLISPLIGILGAFATGSNNNSNVMFAVLQQNTARLLDLDPGVILAAQTAGGAMGSMLAPAKIIVGCSTAGIEHRQGEVLRQTLFYGLAIGLVLGVIAFFFSR